MWLIAEADPAAQIAAVNESWLQYGSFGLLALLCLAVGTWFAPRIVKAVENIAPTIAAQLKQQHESHLDERKQWAEMVRYLIEKDKTR